MRERAALPPIASCGRGRVRPGGRLRLVVELVTGAMRGIGAVRMMSVENHDNFVAVGLVHSCVTQTRQTTTAEAAANAKAHGTGSVGQGGTRRIREFPSDVSGK